MGYATEFELMHQNSTFRNFKEPTSILFKKVNKEKIGDKTFFLQDDDGNAVGSNDKTLTFTGMLLKM